jgi:hypothetical protein
MPHKVKMSKDSREKAKLSSKERYGYLIQARNFHYDNYNKWMTYFYIAVGALFVGYYTLIVANSSDKMHKEITVLACLGYLISVFWYWSAKGYYFWNINFIMLINDCEESDLNLPADKRVYFAFANKKVENNYFNPIRGANISTSKVTIFFSFLVAVVWGALISNQLSRFPFFLCLGLSVLITLLASLLIPKFFLQSKIDHIPDLKIVQKPSFK